MITRALIVALATIGVLFWTPTAAAVRSTAQYDVESYATATCLSRQADPYLREQGEGWASVVIQRGHGELDWFTAVAAAVETELAKGGTAIVRDESSPTGDRALPLLYCVEIVDKPGVRAAIGKSVKGLASAYRR